MSYKTEGIFIKDFQFDGIISALNSIKKIKLFSNKSATSIIKIKYDKESIELDFDPILREIFMAIVQQVGYDLDFTYKLLQNQEVFWASPDLDGFKNLVKESLNHLNIEEKRRKIETKNFYRNIEKQIKRGLPYGLRREELIKLFDEAVAEQVIKS